MSNTAAIASANECHRFLPESKYLAYYTCLKDKADPIADQLRSTALAFLGRERASQELFDKEDAAQVPSTNSPSNSTLEIKNVKFEEAIPSIARLVQGRRVVMLNEAHHVSHHRIFGLELASELRKVGFNYLAVEALTESTKIQSNGYATTFDPISGHYIRDPEFGHFLREAMALGYSLVAYEAKGFKSEAEREKMQATNLARLLQAHPEARVLIYAGYGHIRKNKAEEHAYMGKILRDETGIDPFAIDQVGGTSSPYEQLTDSVRKQLGSSLGTKSVVVKNRDGKYLSSASYQDQVDLTVFHPDEKLIFGRPDWLVKGRQMHIVEPNKIGLKRPVVIRAIRTGEKNGIPIDQIMLDEPTDNASLYLPPGEYDIQRETLAAGVENLYRIKISGGSSK
ncbi:hypothetical protein ABT364_19785 [Massilia sp. SR12]